MTRAQYLAMCLIGVIAAVAYIRLEQIIKYQKPRHPAPLASTSNI